MKLEHKMVTKNTQQYIQSKNSLEEEEKALDMLQQLDAELESDENFGGETLSVINKEDREFDGTHNYDYRESILSKVSNVQSNSHISKFNPVQH